MRILLTIIVTRSPAHCAGRRRQPPIGKVSTSSAWSRAGATPSAGATQQFWPVWAEQTETWERARLKQWVVWAEEEERLRRVIELPTERMGRATARANTGSGRPLICPYRLVGCEAMCARETLVDHLATCRHRQRQIVGSSLLLCPHSVAGCTHRVRLTDLASHLARCEFALAPASPRAASSGGSGGRTATFSEVYEGDSFIYSVIFVPLTFCANNPAHNLTCSLSYI